MHLGKSTSGACGSENLWSRFFRNENLLLFSFHQQDEIGSFICLW